MWWIIGLGVITQLALAGICWRQRREMRRQANCLFIVTAERDKFSKHNDTLRGHVLKMRDEHTRELARLKHDHAETVRALEAENEALALDAKNLTAANEKLTKDYTQLSAHVPIHPKAIRWNGPGGARAQAEQAAQEAAKNKSQSN